MFLLPDRDTPLGLVVAGPPAAQMVRGAAAAGGTKQDVQVAAFLTSRGWQVQFCVKASPELWRQAELTGVMELGGDPLALLRRWPFRPSKLVMQQADMVEESLARSWLVAEGTRHGASGPAPGGAAAAAEQPALQEDAGQPGVEPGSQPGLASAPRQVTFRMLDVGCGSGRDLAWLMTRNSVVRCPLGPPGGEGAPGDANGAGAVEVAVSWECVGLDSWHGALQRAAEVLSLGEVPSGPGGVTLHLVQIGPGTGELRPLPLPPRGTKGPHPESLLRYLATAESERPQDAPGSKSCCAGGDAREQQEDQRRAEQGSKQEVQDPQQAGSEGQLKETAADAGVRAAAAPVAATADGSAAGHESAGSTGALRGAGSVSELGLFDLLVCVRFLERSFLPAMIELLRPGGLVLFSTFVDGPGLQAFGRPQGREHVLQPDELARSFFGPEQGFEVLRDDIEAIPDGREVSMFCARRVR